MHRCSSKSLHYLIYSLPGTENNVGLIEDKSNLVILRKLRAPVTRDKKGMHHPIMHISYIGMQFF